MRCAETRAKPRARTPDPVHLSTAAVKGARVFVISDAELLSEADGVEVTFLQDYSLRTRLNGDYRQKIETNLAPCSPDSAINRFNHRNFCSAEWETTSLFRKHHPAQPLEPPKEPPIFRVDGNQNFRRDKTPFYYFSLLSRFPKNLDFSGFWRLGFSSFSTPFSKLPFAKCLQLTWLSVSKKFFELQLSIADLNRLTLAFLNMGLAVESGL